MIYTTLVEKRVLLTGVIETYRIKSLTPSFDGAFLCVKHIDLQTFVWRNNKRQKVNIIEKYNEDMVTEFHITEDKSGVNQVYVKPISFV